MKVETCSSALHAFAPFAQSIAVDPDLAQAHEPEIGSLVRSVVMQELRGETFTPQRLELTRLLRLRLNHPHAAELVLQKCFEGDELATQFVITAAAQAAVL